MINTIRRWLASKQYAVSTIALAVFIDLFLYGFVILTLPTLLSQRAHVPGDKLQIILAVLLALYNVALVLCAPIAGFLADRWSNRKIPLLVGLLALAGSTLFFAASHSVVLLAVARILQGSSAAIVWAVGLALLVDTVGAKEMGPVMGWISLAVTLGNVVGPVAGGVLYAQIGHYPSFGVAIGLVLLDTLLRCFIITPAKNQYQNENISRGSPSSPPANAPSGEREPLLGPASSTSQAHHYDNDNDEEEPSKPSSFAIFKLLAFPEMLIHLSCMCFANLALTTFETIIPLHVQSTFGWTSQGASLAYLPLIASVVLGPWIGRLQQRTGAVPLYISGFLLTAISSPFLSLVQDNSTNSLALLLAILAIAGMGITLVMTPAMAEASTFAEVREAADPGCFGPGGGTAQCCALLNISFAAAGVIGPLLGGAIQSTAGWAWTVSAIGIASFVALLVVLAGRRRLLNLRKEDVLRTESTSNLEG